jgi:aspartyl/asparaginyl-tRNA synthetase
MKPMPPPRDSDYPMAKRPFYTDSEPERPAYSNSFDLLFRGLEIGTGRPLSKD